MICVFNILMHYFSQNMKLLLCFTMGIFSILATDAKGIQIQIEPDDILKLLNGVINSQTIKNFASQIVQRSLSKRMGYNNPYHPEDDLVNTYDATVVKEKKHLHKSPKYNIGRQTSVDSLDQENENFALRNDVISDDALTDIDHPSKPVIKVTANDDAAIPKPVEKKIDAAVVSEQIIIRKDNKQEYKDDRFNYKPVQKRFQLKSSDDTKS